MLLRVQHETKLSYSEPISETVFEVRMAPPSDEDQTNLGYHLRTVPSAPVTIYRGRLRQSGQPVQYPDSLQGAGHPGDFDRQDAPGIGLRIAIDRGPVRPPEWRFPHRGDHRVSPA